MLSTPYLLDMTRDECRGILRRLELECYSNVLNVFRAQGVLNQHKCELLQNLRNVCNISQERHRAEARRVANDEKLCTIADTISGCNTYQEWLKEGRRHYPLSRSVPLTALSYISNKVVKNMSKRNENLLSKNTNENKILKDACGVDNTLEMKSIIEDNVDELKNPRNVNKIHQNLSPETKKHIECPNLRIQYLYHAHNMSLIKKRKEGIKKNKNLNVSKRKRCKSINLIENKPSTSTNLIQNDKIETSSIANDSTDLLIATSKKDIRGNISKLNSQMLTQKNIFYKEDTLKTTPILQTVINVNNKTINSNNIAVHNIQSPKKIDLKIQDNIVNDCKTNIIEDEIHNSNGDFVHKTSDDNKLSNISFITNEQISNIDIKNSSNTIDVKKIGPLIVRNIKLPNNIHIKGDHDKKQLSIISSGARKVFIQPNKDFQNRFSNTNFINTIKNAQITPLNIKSTNCTTFKKITPITNINTQHLNIRKPNMVILQTNHKNHSIVASEQTIKSNNPDTITTATILPIQNISEFQKKKVIVIGSIGNSDQNRIQNKTINIETKSNIITEDTPVDILPLSDFYIDNYNFQKVDISGNNINSENDTIYEEETIDTTNDSDNIIETTDWELALDEEVNKSKENNNIHYKQKQLYSEEILSSNSNNSDNFHDLNDDIIDESYKYTTLPINE